MAHTKWKTGRAGELLVFSKLLQSGLNVFVPVADDAPIDAVVRRDDGRQFEIQIKTIKERPNGPGYFGARIPASKNPFNVCVDLRAVDVEGQPDVWVFPAHVFINPDYSTRLPSGEYRLPLSARSIRTGQPRAEMLSE